MKKIATERITTNLPLSVVLGGGGVRGLAHLGVLEVLAERGYQISELVGTSVGALILTYYAAVGLDLQEMRQLGLGMTSKHLLSWALLRRLPQSWQARYRYQAGIIPDYLDRLSRASAERLHHGVERIGLVSYDMRARAEILYHNLQADLLLDDALRGSVAIPFVFPPRKCLVQGRELHLVDGGVSNKLPVDKLFQPPFAPRRILAVDVANRHEHRAENLAKIDHLRRTHPEVPIEVVYPDTIGKATILYRTKGLESLIESGRSVVSHF
ncbi:MAG: patatin-like phospholipase family protein [Blastocatellia bacterium]|nr:patatin-like phospholipase family protein [Blastocatellia bacterium]